MLVDLVTVTTPDGIPLTGAYFAPERRDDGLAADALIYLHGDGGHFYAPLYMELGQRFAERGLAFLAAATAVPSDPPPAAPVITSKTRIRAMNRIFILLDRPRRPAATFSHPPA